MKAAVYFGNHDIRLRDIDKPVATDGKVVVKVMACGICGTDYHIYEGAQGAADCVPPRVLGHEFSGIVEETGKGAGNIKEGDRVIVDPNGLCGKCGPCRSGMGHFCENIVGVGTTVNGGFEEYCAIDAKQAYKIGDGLSFEEASFSEPISCCLHGIDLSGAKPGGSVMIIGGGPIGLIMLQLARLSGAAATVLLEPVEGKRRLAEKLGADMTCDPSKEDIPGKLKRAGIKNLDTVIECVGLQQTMEQAINYAGNCGHVVLFGLTAPDCKISVKPFDLFRKELTVTASYINPYTMGRAVSILESGRIDVKPLISKRLPLSQINGPFEDREMRRDGKIIINPNDA